MRAQSRVARTLVRGEFSIVTRRTGAFLVGRPRKGRKQTVTARVSRDVSNAAAGLEAVIDGNFSSPLAADQDFGLGGWCHTLEL